MRLRCAVVGLACAALAMSAPASRHHSQSPAHNKHRPQGVQDAQGAVLVPDLLPEALAMGTALFGAYETFQGASSALDTTSLHSSTTGAFVQTTAGTKPPTTTAAAVLPPPPSGDVRQGTLEKIMIPGGAVPVSYGNTTMGGEQVYCFPSPIVQGACTPFVISVPGNSSDVTGLWVFLHPNAVDIGYSHVVASVASQAAQHGAALVVVELPGYGQCAGEPIHSHIDAAMLDAITRITTEWHVPASQIVLVGYSIGTGIAAQLADTLQRAGTPVAGLALVAPFSSVREVAREKAEEILPAFAPLSKSVPLDFWNTAEIAHSLTSPLFVAYSDDDGVIPSANPRRILDKANPNATRTVHFEAMELLTASEFAEPNAGALIHSLLLEPSLESAEFQAWAASLHVPRAALSLQPSQLGLSPLTSPEFAVGRPRGVKGYALDSLSGIVQSLLYDGLYAEQTAAQWREMMSGFAWNLVLGS